MKKISVILSIARTLVAGLLCLALPALAWADIVNTASVAYNDASGNAYSAFSNTVTVSTGSGPSAPVITQQPQNVTAIVGQTATFTIGAAGSGLTYQWQYQYLGNWVNISGATVSTYALTNVQLSQSGLQYVCVVSNGGGSVTSNPATLTVTPSGTTTLAAPNLSGIPNVVGLNDSLSLNTSQNQYDPSLNVSFVWTFALSSINPYASPSAIFRTVSSPSFTSGFQTPSLASKGITIGTYLVSVYATDKNGDTSPTSALTMTVTNTDFSALEVYPNPWRKDKHDGTPVAFDRMPLGATVKIFTVSGHLVKTLTPSGIKATWDLTTDSGDKVASGIYVYLITVGDTGYGGNGQKVRGKLAVIR